MHHTVFTRGTGQQLNVPAFSHLFSDLEMMDFLVVVLMWRKMHVPSFKVNILEAQMIVLISLKTLTPLTIAF